MTNTLLIKAFPLLKEQLKTMKLLIAEINFYISQEQHYFDFQ